MILAQANAGPAPAVDKPMTDDRKRPPTSAYDDAGPPHKKMATGVNGTKPSQDADPLGKDDLERYQKDAILRQMREYKREKVLLETQVADLTKQSAYHDDHLRVLDTWFSQLLDEVRILADEFQPADNSKEHTDFMPFKTSLLFADNETFTKHLEERSTDIKTTLQVLLGKLQPGTPDVQDLQESISKYVAKEKELLSEVHRLNMEKEQLSDRLESASYRYMVAERKLERAKSQTVQKMEKQATLGARNEGGSGAGPDNAGKVKKEETNGESIGSSTQDEIETARKEATAVAEKRKKQMEHLEAENKRLTEELTVFKLRTSCFTNEDYAHTELFKFMRSQLDDTIRRINDLEATNIRLRDEAQKLQAERMAYRNQLEGEARKTISDLEGQLTQVEADLARVRNTRDEVTFAKQALEASMNEKRATSEQAKEMMLTKDFKIEALESEVKRLKLRVGENEEILGTSSLDDLGEQDLRTKIRTLEKEQGMLNSELQSIEAAWRKAQSLATKKFNETMKWEEKISNLTAAKAKADQKYFGTMKANQTKEQENKTLRTQVGRSSEIISQLKETGNTATMLHGKAEAENAELKELRATLENQHRALQQKLSEQVFNSGTLRHQIEDMRRQMFTKDSTALAASHAQRSAETQLEEVKIKLEETKRSLEGWKKKGLGNQTDEYESLRAIAICTVCRKNFKNTALKTCGHVFCNVCVDERIASRSRKCPNCGKAFGSNDHMRVTL